MYAQISIKLKRQIMRKAVNTEKGRHTKANLQMCKRTVFILKFFFDSTC